jgi:Fe2+ transport system protein B
MSTYNKDIEEFFESLEIAAEENKKEAIKEFERQLDEATNSIILEAVDHFSKRFRRSDKNDKTDVDERYFYNKKEVSRFLELNTNPNVKIRTEFDEKIPNKVFCYIAYR